MNLGLWGSISPKTVLGAIRRGASGASDTTAPTLTIEALSAVANVVAMRITASEVVTGFAVGDITISAGGSLASFATADNIVFTVSWTLAAGANTIDIAANVCTDAAGNNNTAASQFTLTYLIIQPDGAAGKDNQIRANGGVGVATNYGTNVKVEVGEENASGASWRTLIQFDLASISAGSSILSAVLSLYATDDLSSNARAFRVYRMKQAWTETGSTWLTYDGSNNWSGGAGAFGASDCEQTDIGSRNMTATEATLEFKDWTLTAAAVQAMIPSGAWTNNGFLIKADTETDDAYAFASSDNATSANRPKLALVVSSVTPP